MSSLATRLPSPNEVVSSRSQRGPVGACAVYGPGDQEDWLAVDALRRGSDWKTARNVVHQQLVIEPPSPNVDKFRYHWRGKCSCWTDDLKTWIEAQS
jgi:hypothetical protein